MATTYENHVALGEHLKTDEVDSDTSILFLCFTCSVYSYPTCRQCIYKDTLYKRRRKKVAWRAYPGFQKQKSYWLNLNTDQKTMKAPPVTHNGRCLKDQMDSKFSNPTSEDSGLLGAAVKLGRAVFHSFQSEDSPSVPEIDANNLALTDIPRKVLSTAFATGDRVNTQAANFGEPLKMDASDALARCRIWSKWQHATWTTSDVVGTDVFRGAKLANHYTAGSRNVIAPYTPFRFSSSTVTNATTFHTALSYYAQFFSLWRGSIEIVVEVICTALHQGQLLCAIEPITGFNSVDPNIQQARNCYNATIDLSKCNRTVIKVPYNSFGDYCYNYTSGIQARDSRVSIVAGINGGEVPAAIGLFYTYVQNPLTVTSNTIASTTVDVIFQIRAGPDFEMISPRPPHDQFWIGSAWIGETNPGQELDEQGEPGSAEAGVESAAITEVQATTDSTVAMAMPSTSTNVVGETQVAVDVNVKKSTYERLVSREYLLATGIQWTTSQVPGVAVYRVDIAPLFEQTDLAASALIGYNAYWRTSVELTFRANAHPMFAGVLLMTHLPVLSSMPLGNPTDGTVTLEPLHLTAKQYVAAYYTPQSDTAVSIRVPWTHVHRVVTTRTRAGVPNRAFPNSSNRLGQIVLMVYAQLRTGSAGGTAITGTLWGRLIDPYYGFKKANLTPALDLEEQVEEEPEDEEFYDVTETLGPSVTTTNSLSDAGREWSASTSTAQQKECGSQIPSSMMKPQRGFIRTNHFSVMGLLRRPHYMGHYSITADASATPSWKTLVTLPCRLNSITAIALAQLNSTWSGTVRFHLVCEASMATRLLLKARYVSNRNVNSPVLVGGAPDAAVRDFTGTVVWKPGLEAVKVIQPPHYHPLSTKGTRGPVSSTDANRVAAYETYGSLELLYKFSGPTSEHVTIDIYDSVGDDYRLYIPRFIPSTITRPVTAEEEEAEVQSAYHPDVSFRSTATMRRTRSTERIARVLKSFDQLEDQCERLQDHAWIRDLTTEGVEPNPGPYDFAGNCCETCDFVDVTMTGDVLPLIGHLITEMKRDRGRFHACVSGMRSAAYVVHVHTGWLSGEQQMPHYIKAVTVQLMRMMEFEDVHRITHNRRYKCSSGQCAACTMVLFATKSTGTLKTMTSLPLLLTLISYYMPAHSRVRIVPGWDNKAGLDGTVRVDYQVSSFCRKAMYTMLDFLSSNYWQTMPLWLSDIETTSMTLKSFKKTTDWNLQFHEGKRKQFRWLSHRVHERGHRKYGIPCSTLLFARDRAAQRHFQRAHDRMTSEQFNEERSAIMPFELEWNVLEWSVLYREATEENFEGSFVQALMRTEYYTDREKLGLLRTLYFGGQHEVDGVTADQLEWMLNIEYDDQGGKPDIQFQSQAGKTTFLHTVRGWWNCIKSRICRKVTDGTTKELRDLMNSTYRKIMDVYLPMATTVTDFVLNLYVLLQSTSALVRAATLAAISAKCVKVAVLGEKLVQQLTEGCFPFLNQDENEGLSTYTKIGCAVATALVGTLLAGIGWNMSSMDVKDVRTLATHRMGELASTFGKISNGVMVVPKLWDFIRNGVSTAVEYVTEGRNLFEDWARDNHSRLIQWQIDCDAFVSGNRADNNNLFKSVAGKSNYVVLEQLYKTALEVNAYGTERSFPQTWRLTATRIVKLMTDAKKVYDTIKTRSEPIGLWLEGSAGVGKSLILSSLLPFSVMMRLGLVDNVEDAQRNLWAKPNNPDHQYYDGYFSQHMVLIDDFAAGQEDKDALEVINLISVAKCPVLMANLEEKKTVFDSPFVVVTTNQQSVQVLSSVRDKGAIHRRFPFAYSLMVKDRYKRDGKVDVAAVVQLLDGAADVVELDRRVDEVWYLKKLDLLTGHVTGSYKYSTVVQSMVAEYTRRNVVTMGIDNVLKNIKRVGGVVETQVIEEDMPQLVDQIGKTFMDDVTGLYPQNYDDDEVYDSVETAKGERITRPGTFHLRLHYIVMNREAVSDGSWGRYEAQRLKRLFFIDHDALGWATEEAMRTEMCQPRSSTTNFFLPDTHDNFAHFMRYVHAEATKNDVEVGTKKQRWSGLIAFTASILGVCAAAGAAYGIYRLFKKYCQSAIDIPLEGQGPQYGSGGTRQPVRTKPVQVAINRVKAVIGDQGGDEASVQKVRALQKNILRIEMRCDGLGARGLWCVAVDSNTLLLPGHFYSRTYKQCTDISKSVWIEQRNKQGLRVKMVPLALSDLNVETVTDVGPFGGERDLVVVKVEDQTLINVRSIRGLITTRHDKEAYSGCEYTALWLEQFTLSKAMVSFKSQLERGQEVALPGLTEKQALMGDCGKPYLFRNTTVQRPFIGLHVWGREEGTKMTGVADITLEALVEAEEVIAERAHVSEPTDAWIIEEEEEVFLDAQTTQSWATGEIEVLGAVKWNDVSMDRFQPHKTVFGRTGLNCPSWPDEFIPCQIGQVAGIHTLYTGIEKFGSDQPMTVPIGVSETVLGFMLEKIPEDEGVVLNEDQTINGDVELGLTQIVMDTSPGILTKVYPQGKKDIFDEMPSVEGEEKKYMYSDVARNKVIPWLKKPYMQHLQDEEVRILEGKEPRVLWTACNKDELRKIHKVKTGQVRVFVSPELTFTMLQRKYMGAFFGWWKKHVGFRLCSAIGIDVDSQWADVYHQLKEMNDSGFDIDYSNFDGTVTVQAFNVALHLMDKFYGFKHRKARAALMRSITCSTIVCGELVVKTMKGNKSGNAGTDVLNSIANWYNMLVAFVFCQRAVGLPKDIRQFDEHVRCLTYGDDVIATVSPAVLPWYNRVTIKMYLEALGYEVTSAAKDGVDSPYERVEDLQFLKRTFTPRGALVAAPLPKAVIARELQWQKKRNDGNQEIMQMKVDVALLMMAHHGPEDFQRLRDQLQELGWQSKLTYKEWYRKTLELQEIAKVERVRDVEIFDNVAFYFGDSQTDYEFQLGFEDELSQVIADSLKE